ncbi:alpha-amylase family glycosyl hydrolase [Micromonospora sp. BRA006-A]|nr:alpha-amylase family glycosyl hydrolase [Micromonospora sp. BRA006-A]
MMTARFADGDPANNRGGSQHVASGNAANDDPMFRGDFKGLVDKLDYIKALGFSALWITRWSSTAPTTTTTATTAGTSTGWTRGWRAPVPPTRT